MRSSKKQQLIAGPADTDTVALHDECTCAGPCWTAVDDLPRDVIERLDGARHILARMLRGVTDAQ